MCSFKDNDDLLRHRIAASDSTVTVDMLLLNFMHDATASFGAIDGKVGALLFSGQYSPTKTSFLHPLLESIYACR